MRLPLRARHTLLEGQVRSLRDRVAVAEHGEEGLRPALEVLPGLEHQWHAGVVGLERDQAREGEGGGLVAPVGEGRVIGALLGLAEPVHHPALDELRDGQRGRAVAVVEPVLERLVRPLPGREARIRGDQPREAFRVAHRDGEADHAAPVLREERRVLDRDGDQPLAHPVHVARERVVALRGGLVGAAEAHQVRCEHAVPVRHQAREDLPVQVRPRRVAVHEHDRCGAARPLVQVVDAEQGAVLRLHLRVVRRKGVAVELLEAGVGRALHVHGVLLRARPSGRPPDACDPRACPGRRAPGLGPRPHDVEPRVAGVEELRPGRARCAARGPAGPSP